MIVEVFYNLNSYVILCSLSRDNPQVIISSGIGREDV